MSSANQLAALLRDAHPSIRRDVQRAVLRVAHAGEMVQRAVCEGAAGVAEHATSWRRHNGDFVVVILARRRRAYLLALTEPVTAERPSPNVHMYTRCAARGRKVWKPTKRGTSRFTVSTSLDHVYMDLFAAKHDDALVVAMRADGQHTSWSAKYSWRHDAIGTFAADVRRALNQTEST